MVTLGMKKTPAEYKALAAEKFVAITGAPSPEADEVAAPAPALQPLPANAEPVAANTMPKHPQPAANAADASNAANPISTAANSDHANGTHRTDTNPPRFCARCDYDADPRVSNYGVIEMLQEHVHEAHCAIEALKQRHESLVSAFR